MIHSIRISHRELLELSQLADFSWERRQLVVADLKARDAWSVKIHLPRVPHVEPLEIGQQTELGRKRLELIAADLKQPRLSGKITIESLRHRTKSTSSVVMRAISLRSEQSLLLLRKSCFTL
jgi:hypothetical protein